MHPKNRYQRRNINAVKKGVKKMSTIETYIPASTVEDIVNQALPQWLKAAGFIPSEEGVEVEIDLTAYVGTKPPTFKLKYTVNPMTNEVTEKG